MNMKKVFLFISLVIAAVFGFIIINFGLYEFFQSALGVTKDIAKNLLIIGWGAVVIINLFFFGILGIRL